MVKATDIPYDGSVSYFPLTDNSAIITKQLQQDGTSKMVIYKPISENEKDTPKYITENELEEQIKNMDSKYITESDLKDQIKNVNSKDIKDLKDQINNINNKDIKDLKEDIKSLKRRLEDVIDEMR